YRSIFPQRYADLLAQASDKRRKAMAAVFLPRQSQPPCRGIDSPLVQPSRQTVMSAADAVMSWPHIIIYRHDAIMSALQTVICQAVTSISRALIPISSFSTSFLAEISISAVGKTTAGCSLLVPDL